MAAPVHTLVEHAARLFRVPPEQITGRSRQQFYFRPRAAVALAARVCGYTYPSIADALGGRDHSTIMGACSRAEQWWKADALFRAKCQALIDLGLQATDLTTKGTDNEGR
jgi:chromosomal replication initiation ATPase DnaA